VKRREFISLLGGAAVAWPLAARAQQADRIRRIGVLMGNREDDPEGQLLAAALVQGLSNLSWVHGRNARIDFRWAGGSVDPLRTLAKELIESQPDVILANSTPVLAALHQETRTVPIVFVIVSDPVGDGFVASLSRPGGNITGLINVESSMAGKWLQLLKDIAPTVTQAAIMFNPDTAAGGGSYFLRPFEDAAALLRARPIKAAVRSDAEIEAAMNALEAEPNSGLVVMTDSFTSRHRGTIISLARQKKLPAVYPSRAFAKDGGLLSYGASNSDLFSRAAEYIDRILRGAKPSELPVQVPTKFELVINLKTAKAIGLEIPPMLLGQADEVIE
jgi:putative ABC transport system substrate-binding protein